MRLSFFSAGLAAALFCSGSSYAASVTLLNEDFAEELAAVAPSNAVGNFAALDSFVITDGTVDLFGNGGFGLPCPSAGCLDLDGSTSNAARLETSALSFLAGDYSLALSIAGNQRVSTPDTLILGIDNGVLANQTLVRNMLDGFQLLTFSFSVASNTSGRLFLDHAGGDNFGILLDSIALTGNTAPQVIPLPASALLLFSGLGGLAWVGRRRRQVATS